LLCRVAFDDPALLSRDSAKLVNEFANLGLGRGESALQAVEFYIEDLVAVGESIPVDPEKGAVEWPSPSVVVNR